MPKIAFTSVLEEGHRDELERLLFFNANQSRVTDEVTRVAKQYGIPRVNVVGDRLRVEVASKTATQTLYAVERGSQRPIGVAVYTREDDALVVLFVAVHEDYAANGSEGKRGLMVKFVAKMRRIAQRVRGIDMLRMYVGRPEPTTLRVRR